MKLIRPKFVSVCPNTIVKPHILFKVEFVPDLKRFQMDCLSDDIIDLIDKRIFEVTATLPNDVQVYLNGQKCEVNGFEEYVRMFNYYDPSSFLFLHPTSRWHVGVAKRNTYIGDDQLILPKVVSFVNNINTEKGGTHVDYVMDKIVNVIKPLVDSRLAEFGKSVKPAMIKNNLSIFINCLIENPSFESQTKETVTTKPKLFGSSFDCDHKVRIVVPNILRNFFPYRRSQSGPKKVDL